jgi:hypothetical protein
VTNWAEYDAALRQRGSLTIWFSEAAVAAWRAEPRTTRGGQPSYSALAITTALTLRAVFRLALRQTEGLIGSILQLLGLDLAVPDHTTLSRRAETLEASGYNWRALVEADIARFKRVIGDGLRSRTDGRQATEVAIAVGVLNRMLDLGRPDYVRIA